MKKSKMLISLAGLAIAVATTATVAAYTLAGDGSSPPANETVGTQEPAFQDDKLPTFDPLFYTIYSSEDNKGSVSVTKADVGGAAGGTVLAGSGAVVNADGTPAGKVVPIGKFDGDVGPTKGDSLPEPDIQVLPPNLIGAPEPHIEPSQVMLPPIDPAEYNPVLELARLDLAERLGLHTIDPIRLVKLGKMEWANTSLGNPQPGMMYAQVMVPGFKMLVEVDGSFYTYHTSLEEAVFVEGTARSHARSVPVSDTESREAVDAVPMPLPIEPTPAPAKQALARTMDG